VRGKRTRYPLSGAALAPRPRSGPDPVGRPFEKRVLSPRLGSAHDEAARASYSPALSTRELNRSGRVPRVRLNAVFTTVLRRTSREAAGIGTGVSIKGGGRIAGRAKIAGSLERRVGFATPAILASQFAERSSRAAVWSAPRARTRYSDGTRWWRAPSEGAGGEPAFVSSRSAGYWRRGDVSSGDDGSA